MTAQAPGWLVTFSMPDIDGRRCDWVMLIVKTIYIVLLFPTNDSFFKKA